MAVAWLSYWTDIPKHWCKLRTSAVFVSCCLFDGIVVTSLYCISWLRQLCRDVQRPNTYYLYHRNHRRWTKTEGATNIHSPIPTFFNKHLTSSAQQVSTCPWRGHLTSVLWLLSQSTNSFLTKLCAQGSTMLRSMYTQSRSVEPLLITGCNSVSCQSHFASSMYHVRSQRETNRCSTPVIGDTFF